MISDENFKESLHPAIRSLLDRQFGHDEWTLEILKGDASSRQYSRARSPSGDSLVVTFYPEDVRSHLPRFLAAHSMLTGSVQIPELIGSCETGLVQHDVGEQNLSTILREDPVRGRELYRKAVDELIRFHSVDCTDVPNPPFDAEFFLGEMEMTNEYYVRRFMKRERMSDALSTLFRTLAESLAHHPYVLCHRDFHGENIHLHEEQLWILDFQDLRLGPDTYDLASLLRDRGTVRLLGKEVEEDLLRYYARQINADDQIRVRYRETLLQRTIKIIGTFARQSVERERHHYLDYIPSALETIADCVAELPAYRSLLETFPMDFDQRGDRT